VQATVTAFQARGGIIIGDENLAPAIQPDILIQSYDRTREADKDKEKKRKKFSIKVRVMAPTHVFESKHASDWDLARTLHKAFKNIEHEIEHRLKVSDQDIHPKR